MFAGPTHYRWGPMTMSKQDELLHKWADERMAGADNSTLHAENTRLQAENTALQAALTKAQDRITQLEAIVAKYEPGALKRLPEPPPE